ncbi:MAG: DNA-deoxyinosine glycosylase [Sphingobium sp.]
MTHRLTDLASLSAGALHSAFDMVANEHTRVLVLGSLPGRQSLEARRYYANPRNQFWELMSPVAGVNLVPLDYAERLEALLTAGIGLWDVIATARRKGSLDSAIQDASANDLNSAIASLPALRAMAFNGGTAFRIGMQQLSPDAGIAAIPLPSSSSAYAVGIEAKRSAWRRLLSYRTIISGKSFDLP